MSAEAAQQTRASVVKVSREQLPLSCPLPEEEVWNLHPRVYLPIANSGEAVCPYCSTHYLLID
ncbi:zinc-finger domain-containing protein [Thiolapillus sp.]